MNCLIHITETIKHGKKLFFCFLGSIPGPHLWLPYLLHIVLTFNSACYFPLACVCQLIFSYTFVSFLDNFILLFYYRVCLKRVFSYLLLFYWMLQFYLPLGKHTLIGHVTSPNLTLFNIFSHLIFVKWVTAFNLFLIYHKTGGNA